jgi:Cu(I)/Ag(I) efflux system protein CusF
MKKTFLIGALAAALASAGLAAPARAHQGETHAQAPQTAEGEGVVRSIDARANTVTIAHGPIAALGWPAMTMAFSVHAAEMLDGVAVGARVHFTLMNDNGQPMVSELHVLQ